MFLLVDGMHAGFDKHVAWFFGEFLGDKRKYHWVNWLKVRRPKDQGSIAKLGES
jgi:hypothetical protein